MNEYFTKIVKKISGKGRYFSYDRGIIQNYHFYVIASIDDGSIVATIINEEKEYLNHLFEATAKNADDFIAKMQVAIDSIDEEIIRLWRILND
jgi:hypothetical protein